MPPVNLSYVTQPPRRKIKSLHLITTSVVSTDMLPQMCKHAWPAQSRDNTNMSVIYVLTTPFSAGPTEGRVLSLGYSNSVQRIPQRSERARSASSHPISTSVSHAATVLHLRQLSSGVRRTTASITNVMQSALQ